MSTSTDRLMTLDSAGERRFYPRVAPPQPVYIALGQTNRCQLLNLSENGFLLSTPYPLVCNSVFRVSIRLDGLPEPIEVHVRTLWTSPAKDRAGIQLLDLSDHDREQIREWQALERTSAARPGRPTQEMPDQAMAQPAPVSTNASKKEPPPAPPPRPPQNSPAPRIPAYLAPMTAANSLKNSHLDLLPFDHARVSGRRARTSAPPSFVTWTLLVAVMCLAAALLFRSEVFGKILNRLDLGAPQIAYSPAPPPPPDIPAARIDSQSTPIPTLPAEPPGDSLSQSARPSPAVANSAYRSAERKRFFAQSSSPRPNLVPASAPQQVLADNRLAGMTPSAVVRPAAAIVPATKPAPPVVPTPFQSAITGSIANTAPRANTNAIVPTTPPSQTAQTSNTSRSNWPASSAPAAAGRSFLHPNLGSAVVHMDATQNRVTEITPPRSLTSSFVQLPGERVLDSPSLTMHIQRSVRVPGDHWIWRSRKQVVLGELASRVDPQVAKLPTSYGSLTVQATIDKDGRVTDLKPLNGSFAFLPSASLAIRQWHYQPTYLDGKPVETQAQIELNFHPQTRR
jgi:hypothetical protein